mmetsp:Transcript_16148/g.36332  ORF Transcript_16148/g.36332 Transcript_16148/m.36332 type:complete len:213 (+) Transcript_16148:463-1101(+)
MLNSQTKCAEILETKITTIFLMSSDIPCRGNLKLHTLRAKLSKSKPIFQHTTGATWKSKLALIGKILLKNASMPIISLIYTIQVLHLVLRPIHPIPVMDTSLIWKNKDTLINSSCQKAYLAIKFYYNGTTSRQIAAIRLDTRITLGPIPIGGPDQISVTVLFSLILLMDHDHKEPRNNFGIVLRLQLYQMINLPSLLCLLKKQQKNRPMGLY